MPKNGFVQWGWPEMEELLQCPVCLDIPVPGIVEQCRHGHHICANCKKQVESCPLCKCDFHGTRNFVVEELIRHFDVLKNTMLLNNLVSEEVGKNKRKKKNTKLNATAPVFTPHISRQRKVNTPIATKGLYPCRVHNCNVSLPSGRLLNHVRSCHADILTEGVVDFTDNYNETWAIPFENKLPINAKTIVVFVRGIGLIYLNIEIIKPGHLIAVIQMALKSNRSQQFLASIDFCNDSTTFSYNTRLTSVRDNIQGKMEKKLCFTLSHSQTKRICDNKYFKCKLRLSPFNEMESNVLTRPNVEHINILTAVRAAFVQRQQNMKLIDETGPSSSSASTNKFYSNSEASLPGKYKSQKNTIKNVLNISNSINNVPNVVNNSNCYNQPSVPTPNYNERRESQNQPPVPLPTESASSSRSSRRQRRRRNRAAAVNGITVGNIL